MKTKIGGFLIAALTVATSGAQDAKTDLGKSPGPGPWTK